MFGKNMSMGRKTSCFDFIVGEGGSVITVAIARARGTGNQNWLSAKTEYRDFIYMDSIVCSGIHGMGIHSPINSR